MKLNRLVIGSLGLLALILISSLIKTPYLWGINHPGYLPWYYLLTSIVLSGAIVIILYKLAKPAPLPDQNAEQSSANRKIILVILMGILFIILLYQFRSALYLWGDGFLRAQETSRYMKFHYTEPLDKFVQYLVYVIVGKNFGFNARQTHQMVSIAGGITYFLIAVWFIRNFAVDRFRRVLAGTILFGTGLIQLFFGYIESYSLSTPLALLAMAVTYLRLRDNKSILPGLIIFMVSCLFHMSLLTFFPAYITIAIFLYRTQKRKFDLNNLLAAIAVPIVCGITAWIIIASQFTDGFHTNMIEFLLIPLLPNSEGYWLFAPKHLLDGINLLLLTAPLAVITLLSINPLKNLKRDNLPLLFLILAGICSLLFLLLFHTAFGIGRDWDLFSFCAIPLNLLALVLLSKKIDKPNWKMALIFFPAFMIAISFILMNSRTVSTVNKFTDVIDYTGYGKNMSLEALSNYYMDIDDSTMIFKTLREAAEIKPNARYYFNMGSKYMKYNLAQNAIDCFQKSLEIDSSYTNALNYLAIIYGGLADRKPEFYDLSEKYFKTALKFEPENVNSFFNLGVIQLKQHKYEEARESFKEAIKYSDDFMDPYAGLAESYMKTHDYSLAEKYYKIALSMEPDRFKEHLLLIKVYQESNQTGKALGELYSLYDKTDSLDQKIELIKTYAELGEYQAAIQKLETLCGDTTCPLTAYITLANLYQIEMKTNLALSALTLASNYYNDGASLVNIAEAFMQLNYRDSSELYFLKAIQADPQYAAAYQKLSIFYILQKTPEKARFVLEKALERISDSASVAELNSILERINPE